MINPIIRIESDEEARAMLIESSGRFCDLVEHIARFHHRAITDDFLMEFDIQLSQIFDNLPPPGSSN